MALPGADDLKEILRMIGWQMFGETSNSSEARKWDHRIARKDKNGRRYSDLMLHGASRKVMEFRHLWTCSAVQGADISVAYSIVAGRSAPGRFCSGVGQDFWSAVGVS